MKYKLIILLPLFSVNLHAAFSFSDDFESGDTSAWGATIPIAENFVNGCNASLSVNASAASSGNFGLEATICDTNAGIAVVQDFSPNLEQSYRAIFDFNPTNAFITDGQELVIFQARANPASSIALELRLYRAGMNYEIRAYAFDDSDSAVGPVSIPLPDLNVHRIGVGFSAASGPGNDDGSLTLELDQVPVAPGDVLTGIDNDTKLIDSARLGIINSTGNAGSVYFDKFNSDSAILPVTLMQFEVD
ncbi:MAG: hypothetical protein AB8B80_01750 [Marinicellaceae bacterium]